MYSDFLTPRHLEVTPVNLSRVLLIGGCIFDLWIDTIHHMSPDISIEHRLFQHAMGPQADLGPCDLRVAQVPLRAVIPESLTMPLTYGDVAGHQALFQRAVDFIHSHVRAIFESPVNAPTFFLNYLVPQQNPLGRLLPRYDLRNPVYFIEELNKVLHDVVSAMPDSYVLDVAHLSASMGRQRFQDDPFCLFAHASFVGDFDFGVDGERLQPSPPLTERFDFAVTDVVEGFWKEALAMYRTLRGNDRVKMLCIDLDDTMWRGVMAEQDDIDPVSLEGWPIGLAEALIVLKHRGIILAIVSKNDEARIAEIWPQLFHGRIKLEDFSIRKIGWCPKSEAIAEAIIEANVLSDSVVFLDDNPIERAQVKAAHPHVRVIDAPHLDWRRILLWSPEMQVALITEESSARNDMIRAQTLRERDRSGLSHDDFLKSLDLKVDLIQIRGTHHPQFSRALELINKTNQFNTTGTRWTLDEAATFFGGSGHWIAFRVSDRYTHYGLVGVVLIRRGTIEQFVMSCRVFGLGAEHAVLAILAKESLRASRVIETPKNGPCRSVFKDAGWDFDGEAWHSFQANQTVPNYITVTTDYT